MPDSGSDQWLAVCQMEELQNGQFVEFTVREESDGAPQSRGFVFLQQERLRAYLNRCPHLGIELNWMPGRFWDSDECFIQCATHGALFVPEDGRCIAGPCQGEALTPLEILCTGSQVMVKRPGAQEPLA